jgi:TadE-like protein
MTSRTRQCAKAGFIPAVTWHFITGRLQTLRPTGGGTAGEDPRPHPRSLQRSQALIEFALVSPVLLLLLFGIIDIGRAVFYYDTLNHAAREGARVAVRASNQLPTNSDVLTAVTAQTIGTTVTEPCPQGPVASATPPDNTAWLYVTEPNPPSTIDTSPPPNAPGGEYPAAANGSCSAINPAVGNQQLQVTLRLNLVLITPVISQLTAGHILITAAAVFRTEY